MAPISHPRRGAPPPPAVNNPFRPKPAAPAVVVNPFVAARIAQEAKLTVATATHDVWLFRSFPIAEGFSFLVKADTATMAEKIAEEQNPGFHSMGADDLNEIYEPHGRLKRPAPTVKRRDPFLL